MSSYAQLPSCVWKTLAPCSQSLSLALTLFLALLSEMIPEPLEEGQGVHIPQRAEHSTTSPLWFLASYTSLLIITYCPEHRLPIFRAMRRAALAVRGESVDWLMGFGCQQKLTGDFGGPTGNWLQT